jgi:hypothetical protein
VIFSGAAGDSGVASILPFIKPEDGSFDDETTRNMVDAFNERSRFSAAPRSPL